MPRKTDHHAVLHAWDGREPSPEVFRALGSVACGDMSGRLVGTNLLEPIGKRVYQLLEIAVDEGIRRQQISDISEQR